MLAQLDRFVLYVHAVLTAPALLYATHMASNLSPRDEAVRDAALLIERIVDLHRPGAPAQVPGPVRALVAFSRDDTPVTLVNDLANAYNKSLGQLFQTLSPVRQKLLSRRTIEEVLREAIVRGLALTGENAATRLTGVSKVMRDGLSKPVRQWTMYVPITGLFASNKPRRFGAFTVTPPSAAVNSVATRWRKTHPHSSSDDIRTRLTARWEGALVARGSAEAVDGVAAAELFQDELRLALDALAFCGSLSQPHTTIAPSMDGHERETDIGATFADSGPETSYRPFGQHEHVLKLDDLFRDHARKTTLRVSRLLAKAIPSEKERRIKTAIGWAGRAVHRPRSAEGFLFNLVALEALVLGPDKESELTYRLKVRSAHLIAAPSPASRAEISRVVGELYALRSGIVHKGVRYVPAHMAGTATVYVRHAILTTLLSRRLHGVDNLEAWFDAQVLR